MKDWKKYSIFLTPAGAGLALLCFFLPWVKVSCGTITVQASGARIGGIFWAVFGAAVLILVGFFFLWKRKQLYYARLLAVAGAVFSLAVILYKFVAAFGGHAGKIDLSEMGGVVRHGAIGTFAGFLLAIMGSAFMEDERKPRRRIRRMLGIGKKEAGEAAENLIKSSDSEKGEVGPPP